MRGERDFMSGVYMIIHEHQKISSNEAVEQIYGFHSLCDPGF